MEPADLARRLAREVVVLDGGLATQLEAAGADLSDALWSARLLLEDPAAVVAAHRAFFRAGADVATTASYQASFEGFAARGLGRADSAAALRRSVELAAEARRLEGREADGLVAASIGPYGAMLADGSEYRGRYGLSVAALAGFHRPRLEVLATSGADLLACETIPELEEVAALAGLLAELPSLAAWISVSCGDDARLRGGAPIEEAVAAADAAAGVVAIGVNCTAPEHVEPLLSRARTATAKPLVAYPNSGEGWDPVARCWLPAALGAAVDGEAARRWVAAGARLVGGCCRVAPATIAAIAAAVGGSGAAGVGGPLD